MCLLSIILPTRNSREYINKRLDCLDYIPTDDWELIHMDTPEGDDTQAYVQSRVRPTHYRHIQVKPGLYQAWNAGIQSAKGKYLHIATADDYEDASFYPSLLELAESSNADIVGSRFKIINARGQVINNGRHHFTENLYKTDAPYYQPNPVHDFLYSVFLRAPSPFTISALIIRKDVFDTAGYFPEHLRTFGDAAWYARTTLNAKIIYKNEALAFWRQQQKQATPKDAGVQGHRYYARMISETILHAKQSPGWEQLTSDQTRYCDTMRQAYASLEHTNLSFAPRYLARTPDLFIHAFTRRFNRYWTPHYFRKRTLDHLCPRPAFEPVFLTHEG